MKKFIALFAVAALAIVGCTKPAADEGTDTPATGNGLSFANAEETILFVSEDASSSDNKLELTLSGMNEGEKVKYETSDKAVVAVSPTTSTTKNVVKLTAKKVGEATVTATSQADANRKATVKIVVKAAPAGFKPISSVTVTPATLDLKDNASPVKLTVTVGPDTATNKDNYTVSWTSSDENVATVSSDGTVTPKTLAAGETKTAKITATVKESYEGQEYTKSGECAVTVKSSNIPTTAIAVTPTSKSLNVDGTVQLTVTFTPADHTDNLAVTYESSAPSVATVDASGLVTAKALGEATITAKAGSFTATCAITVVEAPVAAMMLNANKCFFGYTWPDDVKTLDNVTIEAWVLTAGRSNANESIIGIEGVFQLRTENNQYASQQWQLICGGDKKSNGEYEEIKLATSYSEDLNKWTHLAGTYARGGKAYLYVNGEKKAEGNLKDHGVDMNGVGASWGLPFSFFIGNSCQADRSVNGSFAYVRVWKKALSEEEVKAGMYKANPNSSDLIGNWYFTEGSGNTIADHSGNGRTLTAVTGTNQTPTEIEWKEGTLPDVK